MQLIILHLRNIRWFKCRNINLSYPYSRRLCRAGSDTEQEDFSVVGVGDVLAKELEEGYGISVIHDKTIHDTSPYDTIIL